MTEPRTSAAFHLQGEVGFFVWEKAGMWKGTSAPQTACQQLQLFNPNMEMNAEVKNKLPLSDPKGVKAAA